MEQLGIREKNGSNYVLFEIEGNLKSYTMQEFSEKVYTNIKERIVIVDMERVTSIDSTGVGLIMAAFNDGEELSHHFYIMNPASSVRNALDNTGFGSLFHFIHSVTEID